MTLPRFTTPGFSVTPAIINLILFGGQNRFAETWAPVCRIFLSRGPVEGLYLRCNLISAINIIWKMLTVCSECSKHMIFMTGFEPLSSFHVMRSTSRSAVSSSCLIVLVSPGFAGGCLARARVVSLRGVLFSHFYKNLPCFWFDFIHGTASLSLKHSCPKEYVVSVRR